MAIQCCNGCVSPKRFPGCHGACEDYIREKAAWDERKAAADARNKTRNDIYSHRSDGVNRAMKRHSRKMGGKNE